MDINNPKHGKAIAEIRRRIAAGLDFVQNELHKNVYRAYSLTPAEQRAINKACGLVTNNMRSLVEVFEFQRDKPRLYSGYLTRHSTLITWDGRTLAHIRNQWTAKNGRRYFRAVGINGVHYRGSAEDYGLCCTLRALKEQ